MILGVSNAAYAKSTQYATLGQDIPYLALIEQNSALTIDDVLSMPDTAFTPYTTSLNKGFTDKAIWLKIPPLEIDGPAYLDVFPGALDYVDVYTYRNGLLITQHSGDRVPLIERTQKSRGISFTLKPDRDTPIYIRTQNHGAAIFSARVWSLANYLDERTHGNAIREMLIGTNITLMLIVLGLYLIFKHQAFLAISAVWTCRLVAVSGLQGYANYYLWPNSVYINDYLTSTSIFLTIASGIWVIKTLIPEEDGIHKWPYLFMKWSIALALFGILLEPLGLFSIVTPWLLALPFLNFAIGIWLCCKRISWGHEYKWMLFSFIFHTIFLIPTAAVVFFGRPPHPDSHLYWFWAAIPSNLIFVTVILIKLRSNYLTWKQEQAELLHQSKNMEATLENTVQERTKALEHSKEELKNTLQQQREFMSLISHELRTPLYILDSAVIKLRLDPPISQSELDDRASSFRKHIRQLITICNNCLTKERLKQQSFQPVKVPVNLYNWLEALISQYEQSKVSLLCSETNTVVEIDTGICGVALTNLINNAIQYAPNSNVLINAFTQNGRMEIHVIDHGTGISHTRRQHIFEAVKNRDNKSRGLGIGLSLSQKIVKLHNGNLSYQDTPGGGATFIIQINL